MKTWICSGLLLFTGLFQAQCQDKQTENRNLAPFYAVDASSGIDVYLEKGSKENVQLEVINGILSDVVTEISGGTLDISMRKNRIMHIFKRVKVKVYVTYVELQEIEARSAANIFSSGVVKTPNLRIEVGSAASVEVSLDTDKTAVEASSAGEAVLTGKTNSAKLKASSAGDIDASLLESNKVNATANSGAGIKLTAIEKLDAKASTGGTIRYWGDPKKTYVKSSFGGRIKKQR